MHGDSGTLTKLLNDERLRVILKDIGERIRIQEPALVLETALALLHQVSLMKGEQNTRLLLEFPNGSVKELQFWMKNGLRLAAVDGMLVRK